MAAVTTVRERLIKMTRSSSSDDVIFRPGIVLIVVFPTTGLSAQEKIAKMKKKQKEFQHILPVVVVSQ